MRVDAHPLKPRLRATHWRKKSSGLANVSASFSRSQSAMNVASLSSECRWRSPSFHAELLVLPQNPGKIDAAADAVLGKELVVVVAGDRPQPGDLQLAVRDSRVVVLVGQHVLPVVRARVAEAADVVRTSRLRILRTA